MTNVTPKGKEIQIVRDPVSAMHKIQFGSGGELPEVLSGIFTSHTQAQKAVDVYLSTKTKE